MHPEMERIQNCLAAVRRHTDFVPEVAVVLGSGLGGFADMVKQTAVVPYSEIPGFPVSTAPGHAGRFVFGYVEETPVVVMQGRVHLYEGYTPHDVVLPVRLMKAMGAKILFVTNASGGIRGDLTAGTLMSITDHISALIPNPLIGANIDELGVRFPDMSNAYDKGLRAILRETAKKDGIDLKEGVYIQFTGPATSRPPISAPPARWARTPWACPQSWRSSRPTKPVCACAAFRAWQILLPVSPTARLTATRSLKRPTPPRRSSKSSCGIPSPPCMRRRRHDPLL